MTKVKNEKRGKAKRRILIESFMVFFIVMSPFVFNLHEYISSDPEATITILGYTIDSNGFQNLSIYAWFLLGKFVPLYLLIIWFFTCKHWWYHIILIPIVMYAFQILEEVYSEDNYIDTDNILWLLPVCMVLIPFVYLIRIKLYDKYVHGIDLEAMDAELKSMKPSDEKFESVPTPEPVEEIPEELEVMYEMQNTVGYRSLSEYLNYVLSTDNLEKKFKRFQNNLKGWLHLKF